MKPVNRPRIGQKIADVSSEGGGLVAKMSLWLQQYLVQVGRNPTNTVASQVVGASPYTYTNAGDFDVDVLLSGGTVSSIEFSRDGISFLPVGAGMIRLNPGDAVRVAYTLAPTLILIPR